MNTNHTADSTVVDVAAIPALTLAEGLDLGRIEYRRLIDVAASLSSEEWAEPTDCTLWSARDLVGHVAGMMWSMAKLRRVGVEQFRSMRRAKREGIDSVDAMTAIQVDRMAGLSTDELVARMTSLVDESIAGRGRLPKSMSAAMKMPQEVNAEMEKWSLAYLNGTIITRDTWLHRVADLSRAVGRVPVLDATHDGRIVADVVGEWSRRHATPFVLTLTGPAGGRYAAGTGGATIELDAIQFCRELSGRAEPSQPLLATQVPF